MEVTGQVVYPPHDSRCWSALELYEPRTAVQLAEARAKREENAVEKAVDEAPLFADMIRAGELPVKERRRGGNPAYR